MIDGRTRYRLPNGMAVVHQNEKETDYQYEDIFEEQTYFKHDIQLQQGACVFDVGANIGLFSLFVKQQCDDARVYAFEPLGPLFDALRINTDLYGSNVKSFPYGLSDQERNETFVFYPQHSMMSTATVHANVEEDVEVLRRYMRAKQGGVDGDMLQEVVEELLPQQFVEETHQCHLRRLSDVLN